jgi:hypothetical protein
LAQNSRGQRSTMDDARLFLQVDRDSIPPPSPPPPIDKEQKSSPKQVGSPEAERREEEGRGRERKTAKSPEQRPRRQRSRESRDRSPERDRDTSSRRKTHEYRHHRQYKGRGEFPMNCYCSRPFTTYPLVALVCQCICCFLEGGEWRDFEPAIEY